MGSKRFRESLEKLVPQIAERLMQRLDCSQVDATSLSILLQLWLCASYDVLRLGVQEWETCIRNQIRCMPANISWARLTAFMRAADQGFMDFLRDAPVAECKRLGYSSFKRKFAGVMREAGFDGSQMPKAILELMYAYVKDRDVTVYARVHQLLQFPLRPDVLSDEGHVELEVAVETKFSNLEQKLWTHQVVYDPGQFFQKYLKDYNPWKNFIPMFSSGSARISDSENSKFWADKVSMMPNQSLRAFLAQCADEDPQTLRTLYESRFFPVPKDSSKMRGITIEPADRAYLQQGYLKTLRTYIRNHPYLSKRIDFWHPELNVELAKEGSISGDYVTIDLSDASDSVLWDQVCADCDGLPLLEALKQIRSPRTQLSDGSVITLAKFAGMGNALTFPIECLEFCKIVEQGIRDMGGSVSKSRYRVYGDDIVVERVFYDGVVKALERNGFKVNKTKSFNSVEWKFRESCGGEFVDGYDVCPVRLPRGPFPKPNEYYDPVNVGTWVPTYIDIANSCFGVLPSVRLHIIHLMLKRLPRKLYPVFTRDGSTGLKSTQPTNFHLMKYRQVGKNSTCVRYQYDELLIHGTSRSRKVKDPYITDDMQYEYALNRLALRDDVDATIHVTRDEVDKIHLQLVALGYSPTLANILLRQMVDVIGCNVDTRSRPNGTEWTSTVDPDYYSG